MLVVWNKFILKRIIILFFFLVAETLSYFNGMQFSAWDDDNDKATVNCALTNNGGWWFRECHRANVNGLYGERSTKGLSWLMSEGDWIYPSRVIMMLQKPLWINMEYCCKNILNCTDVSKTDKRYKYFSFLIWWWYGTLVDINVD